MSDISNAFIDFSQMTAATVAVMTNVIQDGKPVVGYGFNSNGRYAPTGLLRERFIPRLASATPETLLDSTGENFDPHKAWSVMMSGEKPGGHGERTVAVGVLDMAIWDAVAKIAELPLHRLLAERYGDGQSAEKVWVYAAGGYYQPGKGLPELRAEMQGFLDLGYTTVKMKIGGALLSEDLQRIEAVLDVVGDGKFLAVDANGRFNLDEALEYASALAQYDLCWFEEPGDPLDFELQSALQDAYSPPMATGENLFSVQDARNLIRYGGMRRDRDILQFDPALAYGLVEYLRTLEMLRAYDWSVTQCVPHGGHQFALNIAAGLKLGGNESYPGVFQPFGGFADGQPVENSYVELPDIPGIGFEAKANLWKIMQSLSS